MFAVAGVTGHTGRAAAEALLRDGENVRVIVRDASKGEPWRARGAEVATASLDDPAALAAALNGTRGAYLLVPPAYGAQDVLASLGASAASLAQAVAKSNVAHVVFLSSIGAQHASGVGPIRALHDAERRLRAAGKPLTILRPPYFIENWAGVLPAVKAQGILPSFLPLDVKIETIATADIGEIAARLLREKPPADTRVVEIAGPEPSSPRDIAQALGAALGRQVQPVLMPLEQVVPTFTSLGLSQSAAELFHEMYAAAPKGLLAYEQAGAPQIRGRRHPGDVLGPLLG